MKSTLLHYPFQAGELSQAQQILSTGFPGLLTEDKVLNEIRELFQVGGRREKGSMSMQLTLYPNYAQDPSGLLQLSWHL